MQFIILLLATFYFCETISLDNYTQVITTKTGKVQGVVEPSSIPGRKVQKFSNIPYAEAPVGKLRFAKPQPKKPWNGTLKSSKEPVVCFQHRLLPSEPNIPLTEDCLILNIWTPYPPKENQSLSVMVWIHGGAYVWGNAHSYSGANFVAVGNVILVTINYRLSALGFLTTGDDRIKGNFGLFDQRLAMKWVKENIASFGGNPESITIFGQSAGGSSVSAHTLSEKSWPYFNKAIFQSGLITMPWATTTQDLAKIAFNVFLQSVNCTDDDKVLECLQNNVTVADLQNIFTSSTPNQAWFLFVPVIDGDFLKDNPQKLRESGQVKNTSVLLGVTKDDGFPFAQDLLAISRNISFFQTQLRKLLAMNFANFSQTVADKAVNLYQPYCVSTFVDAFRPIVNYHSDSLYTCDTVKEATLRSEMFTSTNIYLYRYSFPSIEQPHPYPVGMYPRGTFGFVAHALDVPSLFGFRINDPKHLPEEQILSMRMILYWTNFAKNSDPNVGITFLPIEINDVKNLPKWPKFTNLTREYLDMESLSIITTGNRLREKYCEFLSDPVKYTDRGDGTAPTTKESKPTATTPSVAVKHIAQVALLLVSFLTLSYCIF